MKSFDIYKTLDSINIYNKIDIDVKKITIDTRKVEENDCYIGIKGDNNDGNLLYMEAFSKGASLVILEDFKIDEVISKYLIDNNKSIVVVKDTKLALGDLARFKRSLFLSPVVAVTGSAGKTSTKDMIYSVLKEKFKTHKTIGNQNNHIGLPLSILSLDNDNEMLVLEMGMNHLGEISYLTNIAKPNVAVITNVGTAHIGNLGSRSNILKAKLEILEVLDKNGVVVINNDNDLLHSWYLNNKDNYNIITVGIKNDSLYKAVIIEKNEFNSVISCNNEIYKVPVGGEHFIYNALVSIAVGSYFGVSTNLIKEGIVNFSLSSNRMSISCSNGITIIDDSYNANYDSMSYAIKYLASLNGRNIAVLGTMRELGEYSYDLHKKIGYVVYNEGIDILVTVGSDSEYINEGAIELGFDKNNSYHFNTNEEAINFVNSIKVSNDNILVKASNSLNFKKIVENIKN